MLRPLVLLPQDDPALTPPAFTPIEAVFPEKDCDATLVTVAEASDDLAVAAQSAYEVVARGWPSGPVPASWTLVLDELSRTEATLTLGPPTHVCLDADEGNTVFAPMHVETADGRVDHTTDIAWRLDAAGNVTSDMRATWVPVADFERVIGVRGMDFEAALRDGVRPEHHCASLGRFQRSDVLLLLGSLRARPIHLAGSQVVLRHGLFRRQLGWMRPSGRRSSAQRSRGQCSGYQQTPKRSRSSCLASGRGWARGGQHRKRESDGRRAALAPISWRRVCRVRRPRDDGFTIRASWRTPHWGLGKVIMTLQKRILGKSGIPVSEVGLGLWAAGGDAWGPTDDGQVLRAIEAALDAGITFFDTSDVYGDGHSEELLGKAMQGRRDRFVVATKIGWRGFDGEKRRTAYADVQKLIAGVESNLQRLGTTYVDVIQSHISFRDPTMEIFLEGFQRLQKDGKVRAYGLSTSDFEYIQAFNHDGKCATLQIDYSILNRTPEAGILDYCKQNGIGVIVRGALAMGLLTGKFNESTVFHDTDFRRNWQTDPEQNAIYRQDLAKVNELAPVVREGRTLAQAALQFTLAHDAVTSVIPGAKNAQQVQANLPGLAFDASDRALIDRVTPPGGGRKIWPA